MAQMVVMKVPVEVKKLGETKAVGDESPGSALKRLLKDGGLLK